MNNTFTYQTRVYYEQSDAGGIMYHANYLSIIEHARMEFWLANGYNLVTQQNEDKISFAITACDMSWLKPAVLADKIEVTLKVAEIKRVSMKFEHEIFRVETDGARTLLNSAKVTIVCIDLVTMRACSIPEDMQKQFLYV